jgi:hypothetical protein
MNFEKIITGSAHKKYLIKGTLFEIIPDGLNL